MNEKRQKREKAKLIAQAEILLKASTLAEADKVKLELAISAALLLLNHICPLRTECFREAISLSKKLEKHETTFHLAMLGLKTQNFSHDVEFYQSIIVEHYQRQKKQSKEVE